jgi:hypothetical protein
MTQLVVWLNSIANLFGQTVLAPIAVLPGWLSASLVAAGTGVLALIVFKYTSNQQSIKRVRDDIKANLLALSLFKDNIGVCVRAQGRICVCAGKLILLSIVPLAVMAGPMSLLLAQLSLWYQARPLAVGEEAVVTMTISGDAADAWPDVRLEGTSAVEPTLGPVRVRSERVVCWNIAARAEGTHRLTFSVDGKPVEKELAVGDGFLRTSALRPAWNWTDALLYPRERPFPTASPVQSIAIEYPPRDSWITGSNAWVIYWTIASTVAALAFRRLLNVNL